MTSGSPTSGGSDHSSSESASSSASSNYTLTTPSGVQSAQALIQNMNATLQSLHETLGALHGQTIQIALLGGESQIVHDIANIRRQMQDQDVRQKNGMQEIKLILENALKSDVVEHLKKQVEDEIAAEIDQLVAEQVVLCLKTHIPQDLQDEVAKQQKILGQVRRDLNNTENRRTNAALRSTHEDDTLQVIYKEDGTVPDKYPPNLKALFDLDATTSKGLMMEYELLDYSESRERNLNRLMQFLGVKYQMVREGSGTPRVGLA